MPVNARAGGGPSVPRGSVGGGGPESGPKIVPTTTEQANAQKAAETKRAQQVTEDQRASKNIANSNPPVTTASSLAEVLTRGEPLSNAPELVPERGLTFKKQSIEPPTVPPTSELHVPDQPVTRGETDAPGQSADTLAQPPENQQDKAAAATVDTAPEGQADGRSQDADGGAPGTPDAGKDQAAQATPDTMTPPLPTVDSASTVNKTDRDKAEALLASNKDYQEAQEELGKLEAKAPSDVMQVADTPIKDDDLDSIKKKDDAIRKLSPDRKRLYDDLVALREQVEQAKREADFDVEEANIAQLPAGEQQAKRADLEVRRRQTRVDSNLRKNSGYQDLKRKWRDLEQSLEKHGDVQRFGGKSWNSLTRDEQYHYFGDDQEMYKRYAKDRGYMNRMEIAAKTDMLNDRAGKGYMSNGEKYSDDPATRATQRQGEIEKESRYLGEERGPNAIRRGWDKLATGIDKWFGKAEMDHHGKEALGYAKTLYGKYGWKGLPILDRFLKTDKEREDAKLYRELIMKEVGQWAARFGLRKLYQIPLALLVFWVVLPMIYGKALEITKPFGGNG